MYVLELGIEEAIGKDAEGKVIKQWKSKGFYNGYNRDGPNIVATIKEVRADYKWRMPTNIHWLPAGDERLNPYRVVEESESKESM